MPKKMRTLLPKKLLNSLQRKKVQTPLLLLVLLLSLPYVELQSSAIKRNKEKMVRVKVETERCSRL